jgi:hypothetical protein
MRQVRLVTDGRELEQLADAWRAIGNEHLMRSWDFQRCWIEHFAARDALRILVSEENGTVRGILPLVEEKRLWTGRTLINGGSGKACLDDLGIVARTEDAVVVAEDFARFLLQSRELNWEYLDLEGIRTQDPAMQAFADVFTRFNSELLERRPSPSCWVIDLKADSKGLHIWPKRVRSIMRRAREEQDSGEIELSIASTASVAARELEVMERIHQARWKDRGIHGCFSNESFSGFTRNLLERVCDQGQVFVANLRWRGKPAAGAICFMDSTTLYNYLASMSPDFPEQKPGWKLNGLLADYALSCGRHRLDFMRGDEEYKTRMGTVPVAQERWMISSPKFLGRVHRTLYRTAREIKHFITLPPTPAAIVEPTAKS